MKAAQKSGRFTLHRRIYLVNATGTHPLGNTESPKQSGAPPTRRSSWLADRTFTRWGLRRLLAARTGGPALAPKCPLGPGRV
jgi:hypothetical protein